jgi:acyl carrier protein
MTDIKKQVREYIVENFLMGQNGDALSDETSFLAHHILDSTGVLELVSFIEGTYGIFVADDEITPENLDSLNAIAAYVAMKPNAGTQAASAHA